MSHFTIDLFAEAKQICGLCEKMFQVQILVSGFANRFELCVSSYTFHIIKGFDNVKSIA